MASKRITATVTLVSSGHPLTRSVIRDLARPLPDLKMGETAAATFGAWIEKGKRPVIAIYEVGGPLPSGKAAGEIPQVGKVLLEAIDQALLSLG